MKINIVTQPLAVIKTSVLVIAVFEDGYRSIDGLDDKLNEKIASLAKSKEINGEYKEFTMLHCYGLNAERVLIMGLGPKKCFSLERLMAISAIAARNVRRINVSEMSFVNNFLGMSISDEDSCSAIAEGVSLGLYKFKKYTKSEQKDYHAIKHLTIALSASEPNDELKKTVARADMLAQSTNMARDLVNRPACDLTPQTFSDKAVEIAKKNGIKIQVLDKEQIAKEGMNALLAVNAGSVEPPRLVVMEYNGGKPEDKVLGLVGKGVTFDSGGLSLKSRASMLRMHCDMAGAAAVLGAIESIAANKLPVNVVAVMPLTENLVDSYAYKVGDVIMTREGKTVEVLNTDAEGRLILADALSYIRSYKNIDYLVDIATLTGAVVSALGHFASGAMTNNMDLYHLLEKASEKSSEKIWQLPLFDEYINQIKSDIADLENTGGSPAGTITAAMFLKEFVGTTPWVHLDIAGTAWMDESIMSYKMDPFLPKEGGTGVGTRILYCLAEILAEK